MSTILDQVAAKANPPAKGRRLAIKFLSRINVMRMLGPGAKAALAFGMGGPVGLGLTAVRRPRRERPPALLKKAERHKRG